MSPVRVARSLIAAALLALLPLVPPAAAAPSEEGFQAYLQLLAARARGEGASESAIRQVTQGLTYNPKVVALDHAQPGGSSGGGSNWNGGFDFAPYRRSHVDAVRIQNGRAMAREVARYTPAIEARYGVPAPILLSIWGTETSYGRVMGDFDLARSLATLAYDGRRRELFAAEFVALVKMVDAGVPRWRLTGSWAGALGNPQFLPSAWLRLAQDGDGDGVRDLWGSRADTLASIANFFRDAGWRRGQPWGVAASVPVGFDRARLVSPLSAPACPRVFARHSRWLSVHEWRTLGVEPHAPIGDAVLATLVEPDGPGKTAYLLTGNYRVILHYNCSNYYALSVGLLADEISRTP